MTCLFYLSVAEDLQLDQGEGEDNSTTILNFEPTCACADDTTGSQQGNSFQFFVVLRELEAKLKNTEKQLEDLRQEVRGTNIL